MHSKLSCYLLKMDCYKYKMFYVSFLVTTKQKSIVKKKKVYSRYTKDNEKGIKA